MPRLLGSLAFCCAIIALGSCSKLAGLVGNKPGTAPSYLTVSPHSATIKPGDKVQLTATVYDGNDKPISGRTVIWETPHAEGTATVDQTGLVTGVKAGDSFVTATDPVLLQDHAVVTVLSSQPVGSVSVSPAAATIGVGQHIQLSAILKDANGALVTGRVVTWAPDNAAASVDATGLVTGVSAAATPVTITATSEGKGGTAKITVQLAAVPTELFAVAVANCGSAMIALGAGGRALYYDGVSWQPQTSGTMNDMRAVSEDCSLPGFRCTAIGADGTMLHFDGANWSPVTSGTATTLYGLDPNDAPQWAAGAGGAIVHYDGANWGAVSSGFAYDLFWIGAPPSGPVKAVAIGASGTILTYNGATWSRLTPPTTQTLRSASATNAGGTVFAVGDGGVILRASISNLLNWSMMTLGSNALLAVKGSETGNEAFAVGAGGTILHYDGNGWSAISSPTNMRLDAIDGPSFSDLYAVGEGGVILHYDGSSWQVMVSPITAPARGLLRAAIARGHSDLALRSAFRMRMRK